MTTYQPILMEDTFTYSRWPTVKIPYPRSGGEAVVLSGGRQCDMTIRLDGPVDLRLLKAGKYTKIAHIDITSHELEVELRQYGKDQVHRFTIRCKAQCAAVEPDAVYRGYILDAAAVLRRIFEHDSSRMAQEFTMEDCQSFQEELQRKFGGAEVIESGLKFRDCQFYVEVDEKYRSFIAKKIKILQSNELAGMPLNDATGVFADVLDDRLSLDDAMERLKVKDARQFDEGIRRLKARKALLLEMVQDDTISESVAREKLSAAMEREAQTLGLQSGPAAGTAPALAEGDLFAEFEEEDQEGAPASAGRNR